MGPYDTPIKKQAPAFWDGPIDWLNYHADSLADASPFNQALDNQYKPQVDFRDTVQKNSIDFQALQKQKLEQAKRDRYK